MQYCFKNKNYIHYCNKVSLIASKFKKEEIEKYNGSKRNHNTNT